jgi:hypothetical protein
VIRVSLFVWLLTLDLTGMDGPTSIYATTDIALRVSGTLKPHHHDKVEIPLVGWLMSLIRPIENFNVDNLYSKPRCDVVSKDFSII